MAASRAQCIGEPVREKLNVNQTSFLVCLPAMAAPNQLLRFEARLVPDSGSSPLLHTHSPSHFILCQKFEAVGCLKRKDLEISIGLW